MHKNTNKMTQQIQVNHSHSTPTQATTKKGCFKFVSTGHAEYITRRDLHSQTQFVSLKVCSVWHYD